MPKIKNNQNQLPQNIENIWGASFGVKINQNISKTYNLTIGQSATLTMLITDMFYKKIPVANLGKQLLAQKIVSKDKVKQLELELLGKKLLVADSEWFDGQVEKKITALGGNVHDYASFVAEYKFAVEKEVEERKKQEVKEKAEKITRQEQEFEPAVIRDPKREKKEAVEMFEDNIAELLDLKDYGMKKEINARLITLLLDDEDKKFQNELLDALYGNKEKLTKNKIIIENEKLEPTIGNWLKDYIHFTGVEEAVSTVKKTKFYIDGQNAKKLSPEEKKLLDALLDVFIAIKNFDFYASKYDLADIEIFSISEEEINAYAEEVKKYIEKEPPAGQSAASEEEEVMPDINKLMQGSQEEQQVVENAKKQIQTQTRNEYNKIADVLEENLLRRKKAEIIACLELLAEIGAMDNLLAADKRYQDFIMAYFKRNNLQAEADEFKAEPYQAKFIAHFLKFIFLERLGMREEDGARLAAKIGNIFAVSGSPQYAQLAYFDMQENQFKWS